MALNSLGMNSRILQYEGGGTGWERPRLAFLFRNGTCSVVQGSHKKNISRLPCHATRHQCQSDPEEESEDKDDDHDGDDDNHLGMLFTQRARSVHGVCMLGTPLPFSKYLNPSVPLGDVGV